MAEEISLDLRYSKVPTVGIIGKDCGARADAGGPGSS